MKTSAPRMALVAEGGMCSRKVKTHWMRKCASRRIKHAPRAKRPQIVHKPSTGVLTLVAEGDPCSLAGCLVKRLLDAKKFAPPYKLVNNSSNDWRKKARKRCGAQLLWKRRLMAAMMMALLSIGLAMDPELNYEPRTPEWEDGLEDGGLLDLTGMVEERLAEVTAGLEAMYEEAPWQGEAEWLGEGDAVCVDVDSSDAETLVAPQLDLGADGGEVPADYSSTIIAEDAALVSDPLMDDFLVSDSLIDDLPVTESLPGNTDEPGNTDLNDLPEGHVGGERGEGSPGGGAPGAPVF
jgi:hypothetical protein